MELEFDKEIDAILRKARNGAAVVSTAAPHLDADTIAAFAENALPDKAKLLYMAHFADCDRCRQQLSQTIRLNNEADATAAFPVSEPVEPAPIPWYQKLFKTQNLALAMGALVLGFSGILGYLVLQRQKGMEAQNATVSQVSEPEQTHGGPYLGGDDAASNKAATNTTAANVMPMANTTARASNSTVAAPGSPAESPADTFGRLDSSAAKPAAAENDKGLVAGGTAGAPAKSAPPPPPPFTTDGIERDRDEKKSDDEVLKEESKDTPLAQRKLGEDRRGYRDAPMAASKSGPSRSGPLQTQSNQVNSNIFDMAVTRIVSGKTFTNRNGAWYDAAYHGQGATNVRRSTDEFKKLDGGLRNIANTLGDTVFVVWKNKAYRIQ